MDRDQRPLRVWITSTLFFILSTLFTFWKVSEDLHSSPIETIYALMSPERILITLIVFSAYLFISFMPAFIVNSKISLKNYLGFGVPILVIIPSIIHYKTCTAKFCGLIDIPIVAGALIFALVFVIHKLILRWNIKFSAIIILIESVLIVFIIAIMSFFYYSDISNTEKFSEPSTSDQTAVSLCEKIKNYDRSTACWNELFQIRQPKTNICIYTTPHLYSSCFYNGMISAYKDTNNDVINKKLYEICANIATETMNLYGIRDIEEFIFTETSEGNLYLRDAYEIITSCSDINLPHTDIELIIRAYASKNKKFCETIQGIELKNRCTENLNKLFN